MFTPLKELGQNFLSDPKIAAQMIFALNPKTGDEVIEIGPGHGFITEQLGRLAVTHAFNVSAVELDKRFSDKLTRMFIDAQNVHIVQANILDFLPVYTPPIGKPIKIIGSLPYYITSPIIHQIIKMAEQPQECVLLIQKEVAEKIVANTPDSSYMSVFVQTFFEASYLFTIPKEKFNPVPQVDGGVIKLAKRERGELGVDVTREFVEKYEGFLHRGFASPRKMLNKPFTVEELEKSGIAANLRPQNLSWKDWLAFFKAR